MKITIQGYKGSFHDVVANILFTNQNTKSVKQKFGLLERGTFREVFADVAEGRAEYGIAAIENSIAGAILQNYDLLRDSGLTVVGEHYLRIVHNLMALPGQSLSDITEVWSHPMALKQCQDYLLQYPHIKQIETDDTARSAKQIQAEGLKGVAAIASSYAAEIYDMEILAPGIEDDPQNYTRFLIVKRLEGGKGDVGGLRVTLGEVGKRDLFKTSIYIETAHKPGGLLPVLEILRDAGMNMTMLVSRPIVGKAWEYGFYIDFVDGTDGLDELMTSLRGVSSRLQVLGTYAAAGQSVG